jgi:hypothetical protein
MKGVFDELKFEVSEVELFFRRVTRENR